jgi:hypothetical protein
MGEVKYTLSKCLHLVYHYELHTLRRNSNTSLSKSYSFSEDNRRKHCTSTVPSRMCQITNTIFMQCAHAHIEIILCRDQNSPEMIAAAVKLYGWCSTEQIQAANDTSDFKMLFRCNGARNVGVESTCTGSTLKPLREGLVCPRDHSSQSVGERLVLQIVREKLAEMKAAEDATD